MRKASLLVVVFLTASGCEKEISTTAEFNPREVSYINTQGTSTVSGQGFLRQNGGGVVTCAGNEVRLLPAGRYAKERVEQIYGSVDGGRIGSLVSVDPRKAHPSYLRMSRASTCDATGNFAFKNVAPGEYYLATTVTWMIPGSIVPEGGGIARRITVRNGSDTRVLLH